MGLIDATPPLGGRVRRAGAVPIIRGRGDDITASAAGRLAGESVFVPSACTAGDWATDGDATTLSWNIDGRRNTGIPLAPNSKPNANSPA